MSHLNRSWHLFLAPLQAKLRLRFRSKSFWDDFVPYRKLSELVEYTRGLDPDDLVLAIAQGADSVCNGYQIREGSPTHQAISNLIDRARARAERMKPIWQAHMDYLDDAAPRARGHALVETAKFVLSGDVTMGHALQEVFVSLFDMEGSDEVAREVSRFYAALETFTTGVIDDLSDRVLPAFAAEYGIRD